jgi:hypothetical protein
MSYSNSAGFNNAGGGRAGPSRICAPRPLFLRHVNHFLQRGATPAGRKPLATEHRRFDNARVPISPSRLLEIMTQGLYFLYLERKRTRDKKTAGAKGKSKPVHPFPASPPIQLRFHLHAEGRR